MDPCLRTPLAESHLDPRAARDHQAAERRFRAGQAQLDAAPEAALRELKAAIQADPTHGFAQLAAGELGLRMGQPVSEVRAQLATAVRLLPNSARAHLAYARLQADTGALDVAERHLRCALKRRPNHPEARSQLARLLIQGGQLRVAEQELTAVYRRRADADSGLLLADVLYRQGKLHPAATLMAQLAQRRQSAVLFRRAGGWYEAAGSPADARRMRAQADRIDPPPARRQYRPLRSRRSRRR